MSNDYGNAPVREAEVVDCPTCSAKAGEPCCSVWMLNKIDSTHNKRYLAAVAAGKIARTPKEEILPSDSPPEPVK